jgi:hypothetical protein
MNKKKRKHKNGQQNTKQKTDDSATHTPLKTGGELRCPGMIKTFLLH